MAKFMKAEQVADVLDISNASESDLLSERDNYDIYSSDDSDCIPCTTLVTPRPKVTVSRCVIPVTSESDMPKKILLQKMIKWPETDYRPRPQATQTDNKISGNSRSKTCVKQSAASVDYFYLFYSFF
jgi:hypothetical protein